MDTLLDADIANNTMGWQWVAGSGADASPYFRIFNPITQGEKFDKNGEYIREWVPELKDMPNKYIHKPWKHLSIFYKRPIYSLVIHILCQSSIIRLHERERLCI